MAIVLSRMLRGYDVVTLVDPRDALARLVQGERYDVILCDVMMPELTGAALFTRLEALAPEQAKRVIFVTGGASTPETKAFLAGVGQPVLMKPFAPAALLELIEQRLLG